MAAVKTIRLRTDTGLGCALFGSSMGRGRLPGGGESRWYRRSGHRGRTDQKLFRPALRWQRIR